MIASTRPSTKNRTSGRPNAFDRARDPDSIRELIEERLLVPGVTLSALEPVFSRLKGSDGNLVTYRVELTRDGAVVGSFVTLRTGTRRRLSSQAERFKDAKTHWTEPLRPSSLHQEWGILALSFPLDRRLPRLRHLLKLRWTRDALVRSGLLPSGEDRVRRRKSRLTVASYRPERRVVVRLDAVCGSASAHRETSRTLYLRHHEAPAWTHASQQVLEVLRARGLSVPTFLGRLAPDLVVESSCLGLPAQTRADLAPGYMFALGRFLSAVHQAPSPTGLPRLSSTVVHRATIRCVADLTRVDPGLGARAGASLARLEEGALGFCGRQALVHGDLHAGQFLLHDGQLSIVDWDRSAVAEPAYDLGTLRANLFHSFGPHGSTAFDACLSGYEERSRFPDELRLRWYEAQALLRLVNSPYRAFAPDWRTDTERLLERVECLVPC